jgi:gas vesicle protein
MDRNGISAFLLGLGVGVGIGMLFAPKSGEETRELIRNKAGEGSDFLKQRSSELKQSAAEWVDKGKDAIGRQKETLNDAMEAGRRAYRDAVGHRDPTSETM